MPDETESHIEFPERPQKPHEMDHLKKRFTWVNAVLIFAIILIVAFLWIAVSFVALAITPSDQIGKTSTAGTSDNSLPGADTSWCEAGSKKTGQVEIKTRDTEQRDGVTVCLRESYTSGKLISKTWESEDGNYRYSESYDLTTGDLTGSALIKGDCTIVYDETGAEISNDC